MFYPIIYPSELIIAWSRTIDLTLILSAIYESQVKVFDHVNDRQYHQYSRQLEPFSGKRSLPPSFFTIISLTDQNPIVIRSMISIKYDDKTQDLNLMAFHDIHIHSYASKFFHVLDQDTVFYIDYLPISKSMNERSSLEIHWAEIMGEWNHQKGLIII